MAGKKKSLGEKAKDVAESVGKSTVEVATGRADYDDLLKFGTAYKTFAAAVGIASKGAKTEIDSLGGALTKLYEESNTVKNTFESLGNVFKGNFGEGLKGLVVQMKNAAGEASKFQVELVKYGQDLSFQKSIGEQAFALASLGIKYEDLKKANIGLIANYNAAIQITDKQKESFEDNRKAMSQLIVFNDKFGITAEKTNTLLNFTKNTMGGGTEQAIKFSEQMQKFADKTGQSAVRVFDDFNKGLDRFSVMSSDKAIVQFEKLQATAARAGVEMGKLVGGIEKFDDMDEAFKTGGQLNRVLSFMGGSFDTFAAFQADDDERARLMIEAISNVSDKYGQLTTESAKRNFAKQIAESTGNMFDLKQVVGILNKSTDLSKDLADIQKMPLTVEGFTDKERTEKMVGLSTEEQIIMAQNGLIEAGKAAQILAQNLRESATRRTAGAATIIQSLDKSALTPIVTAQVSEVKKAFGDFKTAFSDAVRMAFDKPGVAFETAASKISNAGEAFERALKTPPAQATYPPMSRPIVSDAGR